MRKVIYSNKGGCGIILEANEIESDVIIAQSIMLHGIRLWPGDFTTLDGMFIKAIRYAGLLKNEETPTMCFLTGKEADRSYYYCFFWISENEILNKYSDSTARNFVWKNGKWK